MRDEDNNLVVLAAGAIAAMLLGMVLVPVREFTTASNFTFLFLILTLVVAELGGRRAALVTALASALSLDFFLTKPYLRLTIAEKHDIIAFLGLASCGLIAAAFGSKRRRRVVAPEHLDLLHGILRLTEEAAPVGPALDEVLDAARIVLPLRAAVVRDRHGDVVGASRGDRALPAPSRVLPSQELWSSEMPLPGRGLPIPTEGVRVRLVAANVELGWLDLWGSGAPAGIESRRALGDLARALSVLLASGSRDRALGE